MNFKLDSLKEFLRERQKVAIALSGGLDSSVLLALSVEILGSANCIALTATPPYAMQEELKDAENLCKNLNVKLVKIAQKTIPRNIKFNPPNRCYLCKISIFNKIKSVAKKRGFEIVCDGTNLDDLSDYRPGMKALKELEIASPFLECKITKQDIRNFAHERNMSVAEKPAYACLLTRLEHGKKIEISTLEKIDRLETFLRKNYIAKIRARLDSENIRIECDSSDFSKIISGANEICKHAKELGFKRCSLDLNGYRQGSMNQKQ